MKKVVSLTLAILMLIGLCACGKKSKDSSLMVGFGRAVITPTVSVPLGGYGNVESRMSENVLDDLMGTCIAFTEGDQTILMFSVDAIRSVERWTTALRKRVERELGVPAENVMVMSTHTHSAPELTSNMECITVNYWKTYMDGLVAAAKDALDDRASATLYAGKTEVKGMNFVRHYLLNDGTYAGSNFGDWSSGIKAHATQNDPEMQLVKIDRAGDKKDVVMMNWAAHPCFTGGATVKDISSDYIGTCRTAFEKQTGMSFFFIQAAAGNQNGFSLIDSEGPALDNQSYGTKLAEAAIAALDGVKKVEGSGLKVTQKKVLYDTNTGSTEKRAEAQQIINLWKSSGDREAANALARQYGISSVYEAQAILNRLSNSQIKTKQIIMNVTRLGGIGFVHVPWEMFTNQSVYIKEKSVFETTIIATMSNDAYGYFPSKEAYEYNGSGCYESYGAQFKKGVAEDMADELLNMLKGIKN